MYKFIAPAALAAALIATVAVPTAAQAATPVPTPEIGAVWSQGTHATVWGGAATLESDDRMGIGSSAEETAFAGKRVVVRDDQDREVCDSDANGFVSTGDWECYATPATLAVGVHTVHAVAYDADGAASAESAPVELTVTAHDEGPVAQGPTTPKATVQTAGASTFIGVTADPFATVELRDADGRVVTSQDLDSSGFRSFMVATPAAGTTATYTVVARDFDRRESAPASVEVAGEVAGEDTTAQPAPGTVDAGFTHPGAGAGEDTTAQPAPGPVDSGFTHPGAEESGQTDAPTAEWAVIRFQDGVQHVLARLHTAPNAVVVVTESNGTQHSFMADDDGIATVDIEWLGGYAPTFTAVAHIGGTTTSPVSVSPTRG